MTAADAYTTLTAHAKAVGVIKSSHRRALQVPAAHATPEQLAEAASRAISMDSRRNSYGGHWPASIAWMVSLVNSMGLGL